MSTPLYMHTFGDIAKSFLLPKRVLDKVELKVTTDASLPSFEGTLAALREQRNKCTIEDCDATIYIYKLCRKHIKGHSTLICSVKGCITYAKLRGLCHHHGGHDICSTKGCTRHARVGGLCDPHRGYKRKKCVVVGCTNQGTWKLHCNRHNGFSKCIVDECTKQARAQGLCGTHACRMTCIVGTCAKQSFRLGLCRIHMRK